MSPSLGRLGLGQRQDAPDARPPRAAEHPPAARHDRSLELLQAAVEAFERDDRDGCRAIVAGLPDRGGDVGRSLQLACDGLDAQASGRHLEAAERFRLVDALGIPLPCLLRAVGTFFHRTGDYERAFRNHALLAPVDPDAWDRFRRGLPPAAAARYLPVLTAAIQSPIPSPPHHDVGDAEESLAERIGANGTAVVMARLLSGGRTAQRRPRTDLHAEIAAHADDVIVLAPGVARLLPGAPVFQGPPDPGVEGHSRPIVRGILRDTLVTSRSSVLLREDRAILDARDAELAMVPAQLAADPVIVADEASDLVVVVDREPWHRLPEAATLIGERSGAFGHWMLEYLPRLLALRADPGLDGVPVLVDAQMPEQHHQSLAVLLGPDHPVVVIPPGRSVHVERLHAVTQAMYIPISPRPPAHGPRNVIDPDAPTLARWLRDALPPDAPGLAPGTRVYLSRGERTRRRLENAEEVERWMHDAGFTVIDPATCTFGEQIRLVREADWIVAPDGSALYLTWFARPGTRVGLLTNGHHHDIGHVTAMAQALAQPLLILAGTTTRPHPNYPEMSDYRIDPDRLPAFLDGLGALG